MSDLRSWLPSSLKDRVRPALEWRRTHLATPREAAALGAEVAARNEEVAGLRVWRDTLERERDAVAGDRDNLRATLEALRLAAGSVEPGHYYSPVPTPADAEAAAARHEPDSLPGIDPRLPEQLALAATLGTLARHQPFAAEAKPGLRYRFANDSTASTTAWCSIRCCVTSARPA